MGNKKEAWVLPYATPAPFSQYRNLKNFIFFFHVKATKVRVKVAFSTSTVPKDQSQTV